jgi:opacity protein-like surface antigen
MKKMLLATVVAAAFFAPAIARAAVESFQFKSPDIAASFTLDVVGGQAASGSGELWSPYWSGPALMNLVTLSTPNVHDLGGGILSYRFGGGTDLIGDDTAPVDAWGPVFRVDTKPNLDLGFNVWANGNGSYTGFLAGNSPGAGQPIVYLGQTGALTAVPEPSTWAMMLTGFAGLAFAGWRAQRKSAVV